MSDGMEFKVSNDHTDEVEDALARAIEVYLTEAGLHLEGEAKKAIEANPRRVDTGLLRNSITFALGGKPANTQTYHASYGSKYGNGGRIDASDEGAGSVGVGRYVGTAPAPGPNEDTLYLGTNVTYAPYVHEGTSRMTPNRFLTNAVEWNKDQLERKAYEVIGREMKRLE